jgi:predicted ArsR family transcriptional regulator
MRDVGLLEVRSESRGGVGRPQHLYSLAADAPSLGLEPASFPILARMLLRLAASTGADAADATTPVATRAGSTASGSATGAA